MSRLNVWLGAGTGARSCRSDLSSVILLVILFARGFSGRFGGYGYGFGHGGIGVMASV